MRARTDTTPTRRRDRVLTALGLALQRRRNARLAGQEPPPLFIIGSGRSGNTLVRRVLMATEEIYIPPETFVVGDIIEGWTRAGLLTWREKVWLFCAHFEKHDHFPDLGLPNLNDFAEAAAKLPDRTLRSLFDAFYVHLARANGSSAPRWGDKTPFNTFHLPAIRAVFPDAQFLWLLRDGRDSALSYVEAGLFESVDAAARRWVTANTACEALASENGADVYRQSYEALVSDPEDCFAAICAWANLPFRPEMLSASPGKLGDVEAHAHHDNVRRPISAASVGRWRQRMSPADLDSLPGEFWSLMERLGYDRDAGA